MNKEKKGIILKIIDLKTIIVEISTIYIFSKYNKNIIRKKNYLVDNFKNLNIKIGAFVIIQQVSPISKKKSWILKDIINKKI